jgi:serine protease AprX
MSRGVRLAAALAVSVVGVAVLYGGTAASSNQSKIEGRVLRDTAGGRQASFVINLKEQADLSAAYGMKNQDARGWYVYRTLRKTAARTQAPIKSMLASRGVGNRSFWVANAIIATGDRSLVNALAARSDVKSIESNDRANWLKSVDAPAPKKTIDSPDTVEPGINQVHAPAVWALGYTGQGIVIANQDTGMRWTHNAIKPHYRGWDGQTADHNYNWHDSIHSGGGICSPNHMFPCDDHSHGTHTTGTTSGDDGGSNQVGVAPGAKWIGCRNMDQGVGTPATYTECFQFFIAPTDLNGNNPDPARRPHVMNNSWGCPPSEGCAHDTLRQIVENSEAAGIFVEASAGNAGPNCSSVIDPPAIYNASYSTGALNTGTTTIAGFSSRGPVTIDGSGRIKPNIAAPGNPSRSSTHSSDTAYASFSGTSMAGPHVVGVVALLWSAHPELARDIAATKAILNNTANPNVSAANGTQCGGIDHVPNNHAGYGLVDALAAVQGTADLIGTVGPGFTIDLKFPDGTDVETLPEGQYSILIHDLGTLHNYHLSGTGVNEMTDIAGTGDVTWNVTFVPGTYNYVCDAHSGTMNGSFHPHHRPHHQANGRPSHRCRSTSSAGQPPPMGRTSTTSAATRSRSCRPWTRSIATTRWPTPGRRWLRCRRQRSWPRLSITRRRTRSTSSAAPTVTRRSSST